MAGTKAGGQKAAATNKAKYGSRFYAEIGRKGGQVCTAKGFAQNLELARTAGAKGGRRSKRGKARKWRILDTEEGTLVARRGFTTEAQTLEYILEYGFDVKRYKAIEQ